MSGRDNTSDGMQDETGDGPPRGAPRQTDGPGRITPLLKATAALDDLEQRIAITCPANLAVGAPELPIFRDSHHVFARPFGKSWQTGSTEGVGRVRYGLLQYDAGAPLLALYSLAYVEPHPKGRNHNMLPGRLHIFLGDRAADYAPVVGNEDSMRCDHITIEPTKNGSVGLSAPLRDASRFEGGEMVEFQTTPLPLPEEGSVDLGTLAIRAPGSMQRAGSSILPRSDAFQRRRSELTQLVRGSLEPWHPVHTLPEEMPWSSETHLTMSFVLSEDAMVDKHYAHHKLVHESVVEGFQEDPAEPVRFQAVTLGNRFLIVILKVSRGRPTKELLWSMKRRQRA